MDYLLKPARAPEHRFAFIGVPHDAATSLGNPGGRFGPQALREALRGVFSWRLQNGRLADIDAGVIDLAAVEVADFGDVALSYHDTALTVEQTYAAVRAALASAGVRNIAQSHYRVEGRAAEQPVRVVYTKLKARTATKCGQWPADLSGFQNMRAENNEPFYNFGCATQNMLANQVADPIDLVRGRTEDGSNTARRLQVIDALRSGKDPSTDYRVTGTKINTTVGTN